MSGEDLVVYGDGLQTRDFTYVQDVVRANVLAAEGSSSGSYNIASGKQITIRDLASTILDIAKSKANVKYEAPRSGDIQHSVADITEAKKAFGYAPSYSIQQGLNETVVWFSKGDR
jgi:UDP-glucose 4-epimerase